MLEHLPRLNGEHLANLQRVETDSSLIDEVAQNMGKTVFGQEEAMTSISRLLVRADSGMKPPTRPLGSVLLMGPTGVGKTHTAEAVARQMFGPDDDHWKSRIFTIDCAGLSERHTISRLIGAPPGYIGYYDKTLLDYDEMASGRSVVVFDEIEKADPALWKLLLPVLDEGRLTARQRINDKMQEVDIPFNQSFLIFTSNIGAGAINDVMKGKESIGFLKPSEGDQGKRIKQQAMDEMHRTFQYMPEFPARFDDIIVYKPLQEHHYFQILDRYTDIMGRTNRGNNLPMPILSDEARTHVVSEATKDKRFGAREIRQVFNRDIVGNLGDLVMTNDEVANSAYVVVHWDEKEQAYQPFIVPGQQPTPDTQIAQGLKKKGYDTKPLEWDQS